MNRMTTMNILDAIKKHKLVEIARQKKDFPAERFYGEPAFSRKTRSLSGALIRTGSLGVIAEFKRISPSRGNIHEQADAGEIIRGYAEAGAAGVSVLTDRKYFGGSLNDLVRAGKTASCPVLRKEFILDEYQVLESKAMGADAVLLIAAMLGREKIRELARKAKEVGLEVLLELHDPGELETLNEYIDVVGVNNRDLKTFRVDTETGMGMMQDLPEDLPKIAESGIQSVEDAVSLAHAGYQGFLIGELFMKHADPPRVLREFIRELHKSL